jgi:hypothetical protein
VVNLSYAAADNSGLAQQNPFGIVPLKSAALKNFTIGVCSPLRFEKTLKVSVIVEEDGIVQILVNVIHDK